MGQSKVPAKRSLLTGRRNVRSMLSVNTDACCELGFSIARSMNLLPYVLPKPIASLQPHVKKGAIGTTTSKSIGRPRRKRDERQ